MSDNPIFEAFQEEGRELIDDFEKAVLGLESDPDDGELIHRAFRNLHTLKGTAGMVGFELLEEFAHQAENIFSDIRSGSSALSPVIIQWSLNAIDVFHRLLASTEPDDAVREDAARLTAECRKLRSGVAEGLSEDSAGKILRVRFVTDSESAAEQSGLIGLIRDLSGAEAPVSIAGVSGSSGLAADWEIRLNLQQLEEFDELVLISGGDYPGNEPLASDPDAAVTPENVADGQSFLKDAAGAQSGDINIRTIKVRTERLDSLLNLVGELVTLQLTMAHISKQKDDDDFSSLSSKMERVLRELRFLATELHMVPVGTLFKTYRRPVRDIALKCSKKVELVTRGEETEFDRSIYEGLSESLLHLIRNAIDHGIELPDDRLAMGKSPEGEIVLEAFNKGSCGIIRLRDDGKGIDPDDIRTKAVDKKLITADEDLSRAELFDLLYSPGFSTAEEVSSVSGRGVGMDVVRRRIQAMRGSISIESDPGEGTEVTISLPLSIASTDSLHVDVGGINYLIPLENVLECIEFETGSGGCGMLRYRDKMIGCIDLLDFFDETEKSTCPRSEGVSVIVRNDGTEAALVVDLIKGIHASMIKPLPAMFGNVPFLSGSAVLGDGSTAFVLEIQKLVKEAEASG